MVFLSCRDVTCYFLMPNIAVKVVTVETVRKRSDCLGWRPRKESSGRLQQHPAPRVRRKEEEAPQGLLSRRSEEASRTCTFRCLPPSRRQETREQEEETSFVPWRILAAGETVSQRPPFLGSGQGSVHEQGPTGHAASSKAKTLNDFKQFVDDGQTKSFKNMGMDGLDFEESEPRLEEVAGHQRYLQGEGPFGSA